MVYMRIWDIIYAIIMRKNSTLYLILIYAHFLWAYSNSVFYEIYIISTIFFIYEYGETFFWDYGQSKRQKKLFSLQCNSMQFNVPKGDNDHPAQN